LRWSFLSSSISVGDNVSSIDGAKITNFLFIRNYYCCVDFLKIK